jgi:uncharacterized membrane protein YjfL (UPF0719 family)
MSITVYLMTSLMAGIIGIVLLLAGFVLFDKLTSEYNFTEIFNAKGVSGGAIIVSAFLLGLAIVIASASF